jgi:hypothetical protein
MDDHDEAEQLNRLWDQFLDGVEETTDEAAWSASFETLSASEQRADSQPDADFVADLRRRLLTSSRPRTTREPSRLRSPLGLVHPALLPSAPLLGRVAVAAVFALVLAGAIAVAHWLPPSDNAQIVASALASSIPGTAASGATPAVLISTATGTTSVPTVDADPVTGYASPTIAPRRLPSNLRMPGRSTDLMRAKNGAPFGD